MVLADAAHENPENLGLQSEVAVLQERKQTEETPSSEGQHRQLLDLSENRIVGGSRAGRSEFPFYVQGTNDDTSVS